MNIMFDTTQHKTSGAKILEDFISASPKKAALALEQIALSEAVFWFSGLKAAYLIACLEEMDSKKATFLLRRLHIKQAARIMQGLSAAKAGEIMLNLPIHYKKRIIDALEPGQIKMLEDVISYPQESAARFMKADFLCFKTDTKLKDITAKLKNIPVSKMPLCIYIADKAGKLCGFLPCAHLALNSAESLAGSVMIKDFARLTPFQSVEKARSIFAQNNTALLPVCDRDGVLLGVLCLWDLDKPNKIKNGTIALGKEKPAQIFKPWLIGIIGIILLVLILILKFI